jgi:hypothetical protein
MIGADPGFYLGLLGFGGVQGFPSSLSFFLIRSMNCLAGPGVFIVHRLKFSGFFRNGRQEPGWNQRT